MGDRFSRSLPFGYSWLKQWSPLTAGEHRRETMSTANQNPKGTTAPAGRRHRRPDNWRETVESVVVAFVLAFLIRAFEAEAFVIPTGSMAPTLMGRHKEVTCRQCGYHFRVGTGEHEPDDDSLHAVCPNCRFSNLAPRRSFNGDRILVLKFPYAFSMPTRWDVSVFHYPEEAAQNYIKRLVGIGPEELRIYDGDVYRRPLDGSAWQIVRKPPEKQQVLQLLVYDDNYPPQGLNSAAWRRWSPVEPGSWVAKGQSFECQPTDRAARLQYRHLLPQFDDWDNPTAAAAQPSLVTDFYAYNASDRGTGGLTATTGMHWVGDLTLSLEVEVLQSTGELTCELNEGIGTYQCRFDLASGRASLWRQLWSEDGAQRVGEMLLGQAETALKGTGEHRVSFANVDDRLMLWVDSKLVTFESGRVGVEYRAPHLEGLALRLVADNPQAERVIILYPEAGVEGAASGSDAPQEVLRSVLAALDGPVPQFVAYPEGTRPDHLLASDKRVPVVLLGDAAQKRSFLEANEAFLERAERRLYATGVDTSPEDFSPQQYGRLLVVHPVPSVRDLAPAGIVATGAALRIRGLLLDRDVYYVAASISGSGNGDSSDYKVRYPPSDFYSDPSRWPEAFSELRDAVFKLRDGQYFMLGDNSPRSKDSRLWDEGPTVAEKLLIGRAYFVYWPHGHPLLGIPQAPALWPQFKRMRFIR